MTKIGLEVIKSDVRKSQTTLLAFSKKVSNMAESSTHEWTDRLYNYFNIFYSSLLSSWLYKLAIIALRYQK